MEKNVGHYDRVVRLGLGVGLLIVGVLGVAGLFGPGSFTIGFGIVAIVLGAVLSVTGLTESCLIYAALGIDTK
ncbi:MAG: DUF2892 domain-containing protein [Halodesulfurarchaeum sp.]